MIYGCYTGKDLKAYFCELTLADDKAMADLPFYRINFGKPRAQDGSWQDLHVSTGYGSMTMVLRGQIEFGVTAGKTRSIIGKQGDIFVFIDCDGDGHSTHNPAGGELFQTANMRFSDPVEGLWPVLQKVFKGWPDNVMPPHTYQGGGPQTGRHEGDKPDANFDYSRFKKGK